MNYLKYIITFFYVLAFCFCVFSQQPQFDITSTVKENKLPLYHPKTLLFGNGKTVMTPSGWGGYGNTIFVGGGMALRQVYADKPDGAAVFGIGLGNPFRNIGFEISTKMNDLSEQDGFSYFFKIHKYIGKGTSLAFGGDHLFFTNDSDGISSYFLSLSHAFQNMPSKIPGLSRMNINIGIGSGKFANKSPRDEAEGKGKTGTYIFGSLAYQLFRNHSFIVEWSGINFNIAVSSKPIRRLPVFLKISLVDLTSYSGDGVRVVICGVVAYSIS